ncbi:hypothetical protein GGI1_17298 [Acidithiobacillus sp. GGI-221]|nr:hypothetical protein GGI1_17298 [Acidithiobacillus sp. GGI-221]
MIDEVKDKIIAALKQAGIHYSAELDNADDAPREFDPLDYLGDYQATAIGVTGDYFGDEGVSLSRFTVLLDNRFLALFRLSLPRCCDDEADGELYLEVQDLGEEPDDAIKTAHSTFNDEVVRIAMDAVWRVFHCTAVQSIENGGIGIYANLTKKMHAGIDENIQELRNR